MLLLFRQSLSPVITIKIKYPLMKLTFFAPIDMHTIHLCLASRSNELFVRWTPNTVVSRVLINYLISQYRHQYFQRAVTITIIRWNKKWRYQYGATRGYWPWWKRHRFSGKVVVLSTVLYSPQYMFQHHVSLISIPLYSLFLQLLHDLLSNNDSQDRFNPDVISVNFGAFSQEQFEIILNKLHQMQYLTCVAKKRKGHHLHAFFQPALLKLKGVQFI